MANEIERKFLICSDGWRKNKLNGKSYRQGYILTAKGCTVRIRVIDDKKGILTIKGPKRGKYGLIKSEFEYKIPLKDAKKMLHELCGAVVYKIRYKIKHKGLVWEIDEFHGKNKGLILAEVELTSENQEISKPTWIGDEVSYESRYSSAALARRPYNSWGESNEN